MKYDVAVIGGGTAGCAAAYISAKLGLKTILVERNIHLGGTITSALVIPAMQSGNNQINTDFYNNLVAELKALGGQITYQNNSGWFNPELTKIALDNILTKIGVDIHLASHISDVKLLDSRITSFNIINKLLSVYNDSLEQSNKILSVYIEPRYVIDTTGNCEIGKICDCKFLENKKEIQPMSLRFIMDNVDTTKFAKWIEEFDKDRNVTTTEHIGHYLYSSTAYTWDTDKHWALEPLFNDAVRKGIIEDEDRNYFQIFSIAGMPKAIAFNCPRIINIPNDNSSGLSKSIIKARQSIFRLANFCKIYLKGFENSYISNIADMIGIRTSRRICGKYIYTVEDLKSGKTFEHPVVISSYPVDVHSKKKNSSHLDIVKDYQLPIESLMSKDVENLFVAGRCLSADYLAQGALRVQASCFSMGEGVAKYIKSII